MSTWWGVMITIAPATNGLYEYQGKGVLSQDVDDIG